MIRTDAASELARLLFEPGDLVELRAIGGPGNVAQIWVLASEIIGARPGVTGWVERQQAEQRNIYFGANPRLRPGGSARDVGPARCLFADFDHCTLDYARKQVAGSSLPNPTAWILSGHGVHLWWRLKQALSDHELWSRYQKRLIALLGSDDKIHDPPRIMRLPGTMNFKSDPVVPCTLVAGTGEPIDLDALGITPVEPGAKYLVAPRSPGEFARDNLSRKTLDLLALGAKEGERNARVFAAAADLAGNGAAYETALTMVLEAARRSGLEDWEVEAAVKSAFGKARSPSRPPEKTTETLAINRDWDAAQGNQEPPAAKFTVAGVEGVRKTGETTHEGERDRDAQARNRQERQEVAVGSDVTPEFRPLISNVVDSKYEDKDKDGRPVKKSIMLYKPINQVGNEIRETTGNWPRATGGLLFYAEAAREGKLPDMACVRTMSRPDQLFAWIQEKADFRWGEGVAYTASGKHARTPATKGEVFRHISESPETARYATVAILPHEPPMPGVFYLPVELPRSDGQALTTLLDRLNPETPEDRQLLLAMLMTPGWGGPPGARPTFCLSSAFGRGSGKTSTAQVVCDVWGGSFAVSPKEDAEMVKKRLLGDSGLTTRCVLMDNIRGKLNSPEIEEMITSKHIDGWRPYFGRFSRPNILTWIFTSNTPKLTEDVAVRSVIIRIGAQRHGVPFVDWWNKWGEENRPALIADLLARLAGPAKGRLSPANRDRFQSWQDDVLCRCDDPDRLAALVNDRRDEANDDRRDAVAIAAAVREHIAAKGLWGQKVKISRKEMLQILLDAEVVEEGLSKRALHSWISDKLGRGGPLNNLTDCKQDDRVWLWDSTGDDPGIPV